MENPEKADTTMPRVLIFMDGGNIQEIVSTVPVEVICCDSDIEAHDELNRDPNGEECKYFEPWVETRPDAGAIIDRHKEAWQASTTETREAA